MTVGADFNQVLQINLAGTCAGRPVRNDARLGEQTGCCTKALSQRVPRAAGASRWGVPTCLLPKAPSASARSWSGMNAQLVRDEEDRIRPLAGHGSRSFASSDRQNHTVSGFCAQGVRVDGRGFAAWRIDVLRLAH
ncbi:hypothetical protein OG862_35845 [Streptomyces sp. NBC_00401]|nr:hypothetical protein [Streptomyces sp. NBC_00401]MCX5086296.1 hypothetical protein [Streptomyces sp. NBC_00401]